MNVVKTASKHGERLRLCCVCRSHVKKMEMQGARPDRPNGKLGLNDEHRANFSIVREHQPVIVIYYYEGNGG